MEESAPDAAGSHRAARSDAGTGDMPVHHCPFCGESIGSFWGRKGEDGSHWCEACQTFFRVSVE